VVVFTASHKWYADVILDYIDPERKYIQHRLYRDHCIKTKDNVYIKDLRIFGNRDLRDIIIVDNAVYSFGAQLSNGIPIIPYKDDEEDAEFLNLIEYIKVIADQPDLRECNRQAFQLEKVNKFNMDNFIHFYEYNEIEGNLSDEDYVCEDDAEENKHISESQGEATTISDAADIRPKANSYK